MQAGHGEIIDKVRSLHDQREQALGLLKHRAPCAAATVTSRQDPTVTARNKRLSGNKPPLAER
jgi:hypothetical protein